MFHHPRPVAAAKAGRAVSAVLCAAFAAALLAICPPARAQQARIRYGNLVNERFNTVSSGPQSSVIVDVRASDTDSQVAAAVAKRVRADFKLRGRGLAGQITRLRKAGVLKPGGAFPASTVVMVRKDGKLVAPSGVTRGVGRSVGGGTLTFRYTGFSTQDRDFLNRFIDIAYPRIVQLYGQPAVSGVVEVVNLGPQDDGTGTDVQRLAFGGYNASTNQILLPIYESADTFALAFLVNLIHAFHGPAVFQYDAWEQGFARAAASIIARDPIIGFNDATANNLYSLLPFYDLLNQPALGNPTFFPVSQENLDLDTTSGGFTIGKMIFPRMGMSGAAWLKVYVENQQFFRQFNEAYYAQFDPQTNPNFGGNLPALKNIAAGLLPNGVEGLPFEDWYRRQYVLDTSVSPGRKLYAAVFPGEVSETDGQASLVQLIYFRTKTNSESSAVRAGTIGDEELLRGRAFATYFDNTNARLNLGSDSELTEIVDGEGGLTVVSQQQQGRDASRITMDFNIGNDSARAYLPSGFTGDFQAVVLGPNAAGTLRVQQTTISPVRTLGGTGTIEGGAASVTLGTAQNDLGVTIVDVDNGGVVQRYRINAGDGRYYAVLRPNASGGGVTTVTHVFPTGAVPNLVSFPVRPLTTAVDQALGLPTSEFLLSYWDSSRTRYDTVVGDPGESVSPIQAGRGYWFKLQPLSGAAQVSVTLTGVGVNSDTDFTIPAAFGWNLIGSPFQQPISIDRVLVKYLQNDAITWDEAVERNLVAALPFELNQGGYQQTESLDGTEWKGYWVRVLVPGGVTLLLPGPDSLTTRSRSVTRSTTTKPARPDWSVRMTARQTGANLAFGGAATAMFGSAKGATRGFDNRYDSELPPPVVSGVSISFPHTDYGNASGTRYVADFRETNRRGTWDVSVTAAQEGPVTLSWDNLGTTPRTLNLTLVDPKTGERISLRSRSSFTYQASAAELTRSFQIVAEPGRTTPLSLTNLRVTRVGGRATDGTRRIAISYSVTSDADVNVELSTLTGKRVRSLGGGRAQASGRQTVLWDGRSQDGGSLPAGTYQVRITARGDDGTQVSVIRPVVVLH